MPPEFSTRAVTPRSDMPRAERGPPKSPPTGRGRPSRGLAAMQGALPTRLEVAPERQICYADTRQKGGLGMTDERGKRPMAARREQLALFRDYSTLMRDLLIAGLILFCVVRPDVL